MVERKPCESAQRHLDMLTTSFGTEITSLLKDDNIVEIMINPDGKLWLDSLDKGKYDTGIIFNHERVSNIIKLVAANRNIIADYDCPAVSCELMECGARFQGWLPPVVSNPSFTIRKKAICVFSLDDYVNAESLTAEQADMLRRAIKHKKNILIAGSTASGKTTFANALLNELKDSNERIVVLEDLPELQITAKDCVKLRTSPTVSMRDLVKGALRMRPDRIIVGEVRDGAALELLKAWNTGHPGGICTIHSNSPESTLSRLEDLVQEAIPVVPKRLLQEAINNIVYMRRDASNKYKVERVCAYDEL
ncbi:MAG: P-type conjugative transfer ATPase TrbB [Gammaproteobacteria bacterium]|jgi:type IV secretion system protein VirB11